MADDKYSIAGGPPAGPFMATFYFIHRAIIVNLEVSFAARNHQLVLGTLT